MGMISCGLLSSVLCLDKMSLNIMSLPFIQYRLNEYTLNTSNNLLILVVAGYASILSMCTNARWSTIASKSTFFNKCMKLMMLLWNSSLQLLVASYLHMLSTLVLPFWIQFRALPVAYLLVSEYKWNLPLPSAKCSIGDFCNLILISSNADCCSCPQTNCLSFLVKSYMGFKSVYKSGQNMLQKFTIPVKLLQPLTVVGGCNLWMTSNLLHNAHSFLLNKDSITHVLQFLSK